MIRSFRCKDTQALYEGESPRRFRALARVAERKLAQLDAAQTLAFLKAPPGNHLEALAGDRKGQHSVRINDRWRICFVWTASGPTEVEIVDYH
jgi:proteic killer suppression protein